MFLMMAEALQFCEVSSAKPGNAFWRFLCHQQTHAPWKGCSLHDLIQPSFTFLAGVVLPFSMRAAPPVDNPGGAGPFTPFCARWR